MNKIAFTLTKSRQSKSGEYPIYMRLNHGNTELVYPTGEKCQLADWDAEKEKFRRSMPGYQQANEFLQLLRERLTNTYRELRNSGQPITNDTLRAGLNASKSPTIADDIATLYEQFRDQCKTDGYKDSTIKSMGTTASRLRRWQRSQPQQKIYIAHYTNVEHKSLLKFLYSENLHPNSVGTVCKHLVTFFNHLRSNGRKLHPQHAKISKEMVDTERIWLNEYELEKIEHVELPDHLARTRDAFLFQCWTGLRYNDLRRITNANIIERDGYRALQFIPEKSVSRKIGKTKTVEVPILPKAVTILATYSKDYKLLPVLSNQKMNDNLKDIARIAGISHQTETLVQQKGQLVVKAVPKWSLVTTHIARHTYATLSLVKGVPLEVVSKALGHSRIQTTMIYAKIANEWKNRLILNAWQ